MVRIALDIDDNMSRITLKAMLEAAGYGIVGDAPDVAIADTAGKALALSRKCPALILATASEIPAAIETMRDGVYGYILLPFQPGEAAVMIGRALDGSVSTGAAGDMTERGAGKTLAESEGEHILATLRRCNNHHSKAAAVLGIGRNTLWRKLKRIKKS